MGEWVGLDGLDGLDGLPRLPGSALKVPVWWVGGWVASYPLLSQAPTPVEVELGCDNYKLHTAHPVVKA